MFSRTSETQTAAIPDEWQPRISPPTSASPLCSGVLVAGEPGGGGICGVVSLADVPPMGVRGSDGGVWGNL